ncbi:MAG TPA: ATP-binding protein [Chthoniobacteraceae bacterium]|nr:ATP-binding protein [Chthoniobacteraceae bacterium]
MLFARDKTRIEAFTHTYAPAGHRIRKFRQTKGVRALVLAMVILKRHRDRKVPLLTGGRGSAAFTLDTVLLRAFSSVWIEQAFGPRGYEILTADWFERRNSNLNDPAQPVRVYANDGERSLRTENIGIFIDEALADNEALDRLEASLKADFKEKKVALQPIVFGSLTTAEDGLLVGRDADLEALTDRLLIRSEPVVQVVAPGGVGKTSLISKWLDDGLFRREFRFRKVFIWEFYRQGMDHQALQVAWPWRAALAEALDIELPRRISAEGMARLFLSAIEQKGVLVVLDGLETMLQPPETPASGELRDDVLTFVLEGLPSDGRGAILIATRQPAAIRAESVLEMGPLSTQATRFLLRELGVRGMLPDIRKAVSFVNGSPLLARLLAGYCRLPSLESSEPLPTALEELSSPWRSPKGFAGLDDPTARMLRVYVKWLAGTPELALLLLTSFFDRPPEEEALRALLESPLMEAALFHDLRMLGKERWMEAAAVLRRSYLAGYGAGLNIALHPIAHGFFASYLKVNDPEVWKNGHEVLYEYYRALPEKEYPDTIDEFTPLFSAVHHGCNAGLAERAFREVALSRISRGFHAYLLSELGGVQETAAFLDSFFEKGGRRHLLPELSPQSKGLIFLAMGHVERLRDNLAASTKLLLRCQSYLKHCGPPLLFSASVCHLIRICLLDGNMRLGLLACQRLSRLLANTQQVEPPPHHSMDCEWMYYTYSVLGYFLSCTGYLQEAAQHFKIAVDYMRLDEPERILLPGLAASTHAKYLIDNGKLDLVLQGIEQGDAETSRYVFEINNTTPFVKGYAWLAEAINHRSEAMSRRAFEMIENALESARVLGRISRASVYVETLLLRCRWYSHFGTEEDFIRDNHLIREKCRHYGFRFMEIDRALLEVEHFIRFNRRPHARVVWQQAAALVEQTGMVFRKPEVERFGQLLEHG